MLIQSTNCNAADHQHVSLLILSHPNPASSVYEGHTPKQWIEAIVLTAKDSGVSWELTIPKSVDQSRIKRSGVVRGSAQLLVDAFKSVVEDVVTPPNQEQKVTDSRAITTLCLISSDGTKLTSPLSVFQRQTLTQEGPLKDILSEVRGNANLSKRFLSTELWSFDSSLGALRQRTPADPSPARPIKGEGGS